MPAEVSAVFSPHFRRILHDYANQLQHSVADILVFCLKSLKQVAQDWFWNVSILDKSRSIIYIYSSSEFLVKILSFVWSGIMAGGRVRDQPNHPSLIFSSPVLASTFPKKVTTLSAAWTPFLTGSVRKRQDLNSVVKVETKPWLFPQTEAHFWSFKTSFFCVARDDEEASVNRPRSVAATSSLLADRCLTISKTEKKPDKWESNNNNPLWLSGFQTSLYSQVNRKKKTE